MRRKLLAIIATLAMAVTMMPSMVFAASDTGYSGAALPAGPDMSGTVVNVTPENAQYTLDGAYGSIDGKTINFTGGEYTETLVLGRTTKYSGSNTKYYTTNDGPELSYEDVASITGAPTYKRTVDGVTFTSDEDVVLKGFQSSSGHMYGNSNYDYVRDTPCVNTTTSYYQYSNLTNLSFRELTFREGLLFNSYMPTVINSDITIEDCIFLGNPERMGEDSFAGIKAKSDSEYFTDFTITDCTFTDYFQGIYLQGVDGARIENNVIKNTKHNAIALQSSVNNSAKGEVVILENYIANAQDRAIRLNNTESTLKLSANNNIILNSGDEDRQMFKATTIANNAVINLENNYWGGANAETAVANTEVVPNTTGILSGVFIEEILPEYCASGCTAVSWRTTEEEIPVKVYMIDEEDVIADTIASMATSGTIKSGDEIEVIKGNLTVKIDTVGVTVKNSSDGTVVVNDKNIAKDSSTTTSDPAKPVVPETKPETKPEIKPDGSPDTGDTTTMLPWIALLALATVTGAGVFITRKNHN